MYKFKIISSVRLSLMGFLQSSYQPSEHRPVHIPQHQSSNHLAKDPTIHREVGHLSNTHIKVKFWLSLEHLCNSKLFENVSNKREKMAGKQATHYNELRKTRYSKRSSSVGKTKKCEISYIFQLMAQETTPHLSFLYAIQHYHMVLTLCWKGQCLNGTVTCSTCLHVHRLALLPGR